MVKKNVPGDVKHLEIALFSVDDFPEGTYLMNVGADRISYWDESDPLGAPYSTSGALHITFKSSSFGITGDFNATFNNGSTMTGSFSNVPLD